MRFLCNLWWSDSHHKVGAIELFSWTRRITSIALQNQSIRTANFISNVLTCSYLTPDGSFVQWAPPGQIVTLVAVLRPCQCIIESLAPLMVRTMSCQIYSCPCCCVRWDVPGGGRGRGGREGCGGRSVRTWRTVTPSHSITISTSKLRHWQGRSTILHTFN